MSDKNKVLDWSAIAEVNFDDRRRAKHGQKTYRQLTQESLVKHEAQIQAEELRKSQEPLLKNELVVRMVNRQPIKVLAPFHNPTETLGGIAKGGDDEDDFYYSGGRSASENATANATFQEVMETVPAGIELIFKSWDKQLGQWIFKGSNGREYAIYEKPQVAFQNQVIHNPGLIGLLYNTDIIKIVE